MRGQREEERPSLPSWRGRLVAELGRSGVLAPSELALSHKKEG